MQKYCCIFALFYKISLLRISTCFIVMFCGLSRARFMTQHCYLLDASLRIVNVQWLFEARLSAAMKLPVLCNNFDEMTAL